VKDKIVEVLRKLEEMELINIIYACESGSRAWGFASPDSDYDVRFIYARKPEHYFTVFPLREVMDRNKGQQATSNFIRSLEKDKIDITGFDVKKVLHLISGCNPGIAEWLHSTMIYKENPQAWLPMQSLSDELFKYVAAMNHYIRVAYDHFYKYPSGMPEGKRLLKHYLYTLRAILSCQYIATYMQYPPIEINEMYSNPRLFPEGLVEIDICKETENLVTKKSHSPETETVDSIPKLDKAISFLIGQFDMLTKSAAVEKVPEHLYVKIDKTFYNIVNKWAPL